MTAWNLLISDLVDAALREDIGPGDLSSLVLPAEARGEAVVFAKERGVVCGLAIARAVFERVEPGIVFEPLCEDGHVVTAGMRVALLKGPLAGVLQAERTALNFLQHLSGVATLTARMVEAASAATMAVRTEEGEEGSDALLPSGKRVRIVDTRKTLPGLRALQKYAVRTGGGYNHRFGLYDAVMLKDNHLAAAGGVAEAVRRAREQVGHMVKIEVECETLAQVRDAVAAEADVIMLDNMSINDMSEAVGLIGGRAIVEASGDITVDNIAHVAAVGVDIISLGCLTHSVQALDFSLVVDVSKPSIRQLAMDNGQWTMGET
ncbi:MAG: carboxylating nicotinate-nucleotide diphosphorylase [Peptococcaceae bacterium]|nr:carboxylating nicotinate-nucleotide diphosphorylase [Peptococcaceae bacterium]